MDASEFSTGDCSTRSPGLSLPHLFRRVGADLEDINFSPSTTKSTRPTSRTRLGDHAGHNDLLLTDSHHKLFARRDFDHHRYGIPAILAGAQRPRRKSHDKSHSTIGSIPSHSVQQQSINSFTGEAMLRAVAVIAGTVVLSFTVIGLATWWGAVGIVPIAIGLSGW